VTTAVWLQILLAVFLVASALTNLLYGPDAQAAAEAELEAQGVDLADVPQGTLAYDQGLAPLLVTIVIALGLVVLALLNGAGKRPARIITWVVQPIVLICGAILFAGQFVGEQMMQMAVENAGSDALANADMGAVVDAAYGAYPAWTAIISYGVLALATLGSLAIIILLAVPSANAYFRKAQGPAHIPGAPPA
jgi:uncharacterized membrane protein YsdA (DUF1294 family)